MLNRSTSMDYSNYKCELTLSIQIHKSCYFLTVWLAHLPELLTLWFSCPAVRIGGSLSCTEGWVACTEDSVVCIEGWVACTEGSVVCTEGSVVCTEGSVVCTEGSVVCTGGFGSSNRLESETIKTFIHGRWSFISRTISPGGHLAVFRGTRSTVVHNFLKLSGMCGGTELTNHL